MTKRSGNREKRRGSTHVEAIRRQFHGALMGETWQSDEQVTMTVRADSVPDVVRFLYYRRGGWISVVVGNDERPINGNFALYYVLSMEESDPCICVVRSEVSPEEGTFPSVAARVPACVWGEREIRDMFGLTPIGIPDGRRLVLPDDWPEGLYPLRKDSMDYRHRPELAADLENYEFLNRAEPGTTTVIPMGPLHITSDEPGHFRLFVEGEYIVDADYRMFYVHRGMEKVAEARMTYDTVPFLADRICGICGCAHSVAYAQSVENSQEILVPERAQVIRSILLEVERLHSHLLNLGLVCHFCGFDTGFMHFFRVREKATNLAEMLTGARKTYGINLIGGVRRDILSDQSMKTIRMLGELRQETDHLVEALLSTANFESRTAGIGILDPEVARDYSPVGPTIRGSGFSRDTRFDHPFAGYRYTDKKACVHDGCDVKSRTLVRVEEFFDSLDMIQAWLENTPTGPILNESWKYEPHRFAVGFTEAPRGEDLHWSMTGNNQKCYRWRAKASTYSNWPVLRSMLRGNTIADAAVIVGSIDPCYSCTDRVTVVDIGKKSETVITKQELEDYCRDRTRSPLMGRW